MLSPLPTVDNPWSDDGGEDLRASKNYRHRGALPAIGAAFPMMSLYGCAPKAARRVRERHLIATRARRATSWHRRNNEIAAGSREPTRPRHGAHQLGTNPEILAADLVGNPREPCVAGLGAFQPI